MAFYFFFSAIESLFTGIFLISLGSELENQILFNLSLSRLLISAIVLLISAIFFTFAIIAVRKFHRKEDFLSKLLTSKKNLLIVSIISILVSILTTFILSRNHHFGGEWKHIILQLKPVFALIQILASQTLFFILLWFSTYFVVHKEKKTIHEVKKEILPVIVLFLIMAGIKWFAVSSTSFGPTGRGDEMTYYDMVDSLDRGFFSFSQTHHYPPLYPIALLPTLAFNQNTYLLIKIFNALITTSIIFPAFLISRNFLDEKQSLIPALISCLTPYHQIIPMRIVSENLYYPIFLWVFFIVLKKPEGKSISLFWDILTGVGLGLLYLTRYISLAVIPMFLISWWFKPFDENDRIFKPSKKKIVRFILITLVAIVVFSPWIIGGLIENVPVKIMLGFGITSRTNPEQLTLKNLLTWITIYCLYITLLAAPVLPYLLASIPNLFSKDRRNEFVHFILEILFITLGLLTAASRHSWRAHYNIDYPVRVMGRYVLYLISPFIILAFSKIKLEKNKSENNQKIIWPLVLSLIFVLFAYLTIVNGSFFNVGRNFINPYGSFDAYYAGLLGTIFFILIGILYFIYWFFSRKSNQNLITIAGIVCIIFYVFGWSAYRQDVLPLQQYPFLSSEISKFARDVIPESELEESISLVVPSSADSDQRAEFYNGLRVRDIDNTRILNPDGDETPELDTNYGFIIHEQVCEDMSESSESRNAVFLNQAYCIELITK